MGNGSWVSGVPRGARLEAKLRSGGVNFPRLQPRPHRSAFSTATPSPFSNFPLSQVSQSSAFPRLPIFRVFPRLPTFRPKSRPAGDGRPYRIPVKGHGLMGEG